MGTLAGCSCPLQDARERSHVQDTWNTYHFNAVQLGNLDTCNCMIHGEFVRESLLPYVKLERGLQILFG